MAYSDARRNSFFPRTIPLWNGLPSSVVSSKTAEEFKALNFLNLDQGFSGIRFSNKYASV